MKCLWPVAILIAANFAAASNPVPLLYQPLKPAAVVPGHSGFSLYVSGNGFAPGAAVLWNGSALPTTFVSSRQLNASVPPSDVVKAMTATITVKNPKVTVASNPVYFLVREPSATKLEWEVSLAPTQHFPQGLALGDVDNDALLDQVVTNESSNSISVLLGNGDGTFRPTLNYPAGNQPVAAALGDFDGDGKLDIAIADRANAGRVAILLNQGSGKFSAPVYYPTEANPSYEILADFNGDGKLDLAVAYGAAQGFSILLGSGDGTFQAPRPYGADKTIYCLTAGDFTGDGKLDIAAVGAEGLTIFPGNGDGSFKAGTYFYAEPTPEGVTAGDFNGDGKLDLATASTVGLDGYGIVQIFQATGSGSFQLRQTLYPPTICATSVALGDFNGDGFIDIVANDQCSPNVTFLEGDGTGKFTIADLSNSNGAGGLVAVGDFNGDGKLDVAMPEGNWGIDGSQILLQQ